MISAMFWGAVGGQHPWRSFMIHWGFADSHLYTPFQAPGDVGSAQARSTVSEMCGMRSVRVLLGRLGPPRKKVPSCVSGWRS